MVVRSLLHASFRFFRRHPWQFWLSLLSLALGTAVVVAVGLANDSAQRAFGLSLDTLIGRATHQIVSGPGGFDDAFYTQLRIKLGIRNSAPVVEGLLRLKGETFTVLGVDPFAESMFRGVTTRISRTLLTEMLITPGGVIIAESTAKRLKLNPGSRYPAEINGQHRDVTLLGLVQDEPPAGLEGLMITDIATAQGLLDKYGRLDRIDLVLDQSAAESLAVQLPGHLQLKSANARRGALEQMTQAFHINLTALSLLAMVVGGFLIYNTMTFSVLQRRSQLAVQRMIGVTGRQIFVHVLLEALLLGMIGGLIGLLLGVGLGQGLLKLVTRTINDLYFVLNVNALHLHPLLFVKGLAVALGATLLAATGPALEAARTPPIAVQRRSDLEQKSRRMIPFLALAGGALVLLGIALSGASDRSLLIGFFALFLIIAGYSITVPYLTSIALRLMRRIKLDNGFWWSLAVRGVHAGLSRTSLAIAALAVAVSATVGVGIMISSFRASVSDWLDLTLRSDLYVSAASTVSSRPEGTLEPFWLEQIKTQNGIESFSTGRSLKLDIQGVPTNTLVLAPGKASARGFDFLQGDMKAIWPRFLRGEVVLISEPLAYHQGFKRGDSLTVLSDRHGPVTLEIAGVFRDYSSTQGMLVIPRIFYDRHWNDPQISTIGIMLKPDADPAQIKANLRKLAAHSAQAVLVRSNTEIREHSLLVFDRTFAITEVLRLLALGVAFVGVFSALMALLLERRREYAILRATGVTPRGLGGIITLQTAIIGLMAGLLALPLGWVMSELLIQVINQRAFGWSMSRSLPPGVILQAIGLSLGAALLAGIYPAWRIAHGKVAEALREE